MWNVSTKYQIGEGDSGKWLKDLKMKEMHDNVWSGRKLLFVVPRYYCIYFKPFQIKEVKHLVRWLDPLKLRNYYLKETI